MVAGFCFFLAQMLFITFGAYGLFFDHAGHKSTAAIAVVFSVLKVLSYGFAFVFFTAASISLIDFVLGALLSFVMFLCLFSLLFHAFALSA